MYFPGVAQQIVIYPFRNSFDTGRVPFKEYIVFLLPMAQTLKTTTRIYKRVHQYRIP